MTATRREFVCLAIGGVAAAAAPTLVWADATLIEEVQTYIGGATAATGGLTIGAPEIAENGNTVPVSFTVEADPAAITEVRMFADGNPAPGVGAFRFGPLAGSATASTRIRLAKTQNVVVVAKMADGSVRVASREVKVTIGGCGG